MTKNINAEIVAIGTEILLGEITDTNSVFIARSLRDIGINVYFMTSVGDNEERIAAAIRVAMSRAQVVITCGGLGPTVDDMTRQAVATAIGRGLFFHQHLLDLIVERFASFRAQMTENNKRQAYLPENAIVIENPVGTAPSFIVEHENRIVISLPGVPREMKYLMTESVIPYLREKYQMGSSIIKARVLRTAGIGESLLDNEIGAELLEMSNPTVGLAAHAGQVDVRITAKADNEDLANEMIAEVEAQIRERLGQYIFGVDDEQIESVLVQMLNSRHLTIATSETGIGNPISKRIQSARGGEKVLVSFQIQSELSQIKDIFGVSIELPIRELAERVAEFVCKTNHTSAAIAVVSRSDMNDDQADTEGGTAIAVYTPQKQRSRVYGFGGRGETAQNWTSTWAISMLWQMLAE